MSRETAQLFDLMFKWIIKGASTPAVVHFINGIYKKDYPLVGTQVTIEPNELIKEDPESGALEKIVTDIIITLQHGERKDIFLVEAQIDDDIEMMIRIFNYSVFIALEKRRVSGGGSRMEIEMPSPVVIYWEAMKFLRSRYCSILFPSLRAWLSCFHFTYLRYAVSWRRRVRTQRRGRLWQQSLMGI
jgi:hypothetical protein